MISSIYSYLSKNLKDLKLKNIALLFLSIMLVACSSTSSSQITGYDIWLRHSYLPPITDNRFTPNERFPNSFGRAEYFDNKMVKLTYDIEQSITSITRCDEPITICRHGVIKPSVKITYDTTNLKNGRLWAEGTFTFDIAKTQTFSDGFVYVKNSISEGFPLLKEETVEIPFSGFIETGKPLTVSGPYDSEFQIAIGEIKARKRI